VLVICGGSSPRAHFTTQAKSLRQSDLTLATQISSAANAEHRLHSTSRFVFVLPVVVSEFRYRSESLLLHPGGDYRVTLST
jgi:hypothetical protein